MAKNLQQEKMGKISKTSTKARKKLAEIKKQNVRKSKKLNRRCVKKKPLCIDPHTNR